MSIDAAGDDDVDVDESNHWQGGILLVPALISLPSLPRTAFTEEAHVGNLPILYLSKGTKRSR